MNPTKSLVNALLQSDSVIQRLKKELDQEQQIYNELKKELKQDLQAILFARLPFSSSDFHLNIIKGEFEITNLKIPTDNNTFEAIKDLLEVNSYKIFLKSAPSKIKFYNKEGAVANEF